MARVSLGVAGLVAIAYLGIGWYVSGEILDGLRSQPYIPEYDTDVLAVDTASVTLGLADEETIVADRDAVMGIRWDGGYAQLGQATSFDDTTETRPITVMVGGLPPVGQNVVDLDSFAFTGVPSDHGVYHEEVSVPGPLGDLQAWFVPGERSTWIVAVHGLGSDRAEFLRLVDANIELGHPLLIARYRNDPASPLANGSLVLAGQEEWTDVEAMVDYATARGAEGVVLYGTSMGGALVLGLLVEGEDLSMIRGAVLEAPLADLREVVARRSGEALPIGGLVGDSMLAAGRLMAWLRTGIDFDDIDYVERAGELTTPILLFHGTADEKIPYSVGRALADARPDLIRFETLEDAAHVRAWNEGPSEYIDALAEFLTEVGG